MPPICLRGSENINRSPILQLEPFAQLGHGKGKVAGGDVGLSHVAKHRLQLFLVHRREGLDAELPPWKQREVTLGDKEMRVGCYLPNAQLGAHSRETTGLHD